MKLQPTDLSAALAAGKNVKLIDVRTPSEFGEVHLEGSELMPLDRLDPAALSASAESADPCVLICRTGRRATQAQERLAAASFSRTLVLDGGVDAWVAQGFPVNRGASTISLERQVRIMAGFLIVVGVIFGTWLHPAFYALSGFVGAGLMFAGITDWCGMAMVLARMPWNQRSGITCAGKSCSN